LQLKAAGFKAECIALGGKGWKGQG